MEILNLPLTIKVFKEGSSRENPFVAYNPELDISSCGKTEEDARNMLKESVSVLLDGAKEDGTLNQILVKMKKNSIVDSLFGSWGKGINGKNFLKKVRYGNNTM